MRTTITLDDDVASRLKKMSQEQKYAFKKTLNDALRLGLERMENPPKAKPYKTRPKALGLKPGLSYDNVGELLEITEGAGYQ